MSTKTFPLAIHCAGKERVIGYPAATHVSKEVISATVGAGEGSVCAQPRVTKVREQRKQTSILYINIAYNTDKKRKRAQIKDFSQPVYGVASILVMSTDFSVRWVKMPHAGYTGVHADTTAMLHNEHT